MAKKRPVVAENVADNMNAADSKLASMFEKAADTSAAESHDNAADDSPMHEQTVSEVNASMSIADQLKDLEKRNADLNTENEDLKSRIADYLLELDQLRNNSSGVLAEENVKLVELERKCKELEDASDKYLMRISELTFDNARLNASVQQLEHDMQRQNVQTPSAPVEPVCLKTHLERPHANPYSQNGYSSWN